MKKIYLTVLLLLGIQLFFLVNLQFTAWPEMFSYAYLRNHDFLIYRDMIHPYPPLLTMVMSWVYELFGYNLWVLKAAAWAVALSTSVLVFLITKHITKSDRAALISLGAYVFLQPFLEGNMLWFDLAIMPSLLLGLLFLVRGNLFLAGLFIAATILIKQTTGIYLIFSILYLVFAQKTPFSELKKFFYGSIILGVPFLVRLIQEGALSDFMNWVLVYPLTKWGSIIGYIRMEMSPQEIAVVLILITPIILNLKRLWKDAKARIVLIFLACALIAVYPRFSFFHFQSTLALLLMVYGFLLSKIKISRSTIAYFLLPIALIFFLVHVSVLVRDWQKEPRFYTQDDITLARVIDDRVGKDEGVYLLGLHSGLYSMSNSLPPERWTDNFAWYLEIPGVQEEIMSRWEENPPKYIFWRTPSPGNPFDLATYQPAEIVEWIESNYSQKEEVHPDIWMWESIK